MIGRGAQISRRSMDWTRTKNKVLTYGLSMSEGKSVYICSVTTFEGGVKSQLS